jgi:isocitrate dehydrogenase
VDVDQEPEVGREIVVKDVIADAFLQQILLRPPSTTSSRRSTSTATTSATRWPPRSGGIGIAPGANLSDTVAMFEATHGTAPKYAGKDYVNPGSEILSAQMMLVHMGWKEAAQLIETGLEKAIGDKVVDRPTSRGLMEGDTQALVLRLRQAMIERL